VNTACLIGLVACRPRPLGVEGEVGFLLLTPRDPAGERVDRHRVILSPLHTPDLAEFLPGATVYIEGHLARHGHHRRVSVIADHAWSIQPPPPPPGNDRPTGTHAPPREHQRAGHARRVAIGTARERLIWVRPTTVHPNAPSALDRHPKPRHRPSQQEPRQHLAVTRAARR